VVGYVWLVSEAFDDEQASLTIEAERFKIISISNNFKFGRKASFQTELSERGYR